MAWACAIQILDLLITTAVFARKMLEKEQYPCDSWNAQLLLDANAVLGGLVTSDESNTESGP